MKLYLLTKGDGSDGNEWDLLSIHSTRGLADIAKKKYQKPNYRDDGSSYVYYASVEEWTVDE